MPTASAKDSPCDANGNRRPGAAVFFPAWTLVGCLSYLRYYLEDHRARLWPDMLVWLACFYPWVLLGPMVFRLEECFPLGRTRLSRNLLVVALASVGFSYVAYLLSVVFAVAMQSLLRESFSVESGGWVIPWSEFLIQQALFWMTVGGSGIFRRLTRLREREREANRLTLEKSRLEASLKQAELETLRMRLNPHFLFNTLQNISVLTQQEPRTASQMLTRLGDLLRAAFRRDSEPEVTLETEIALTQTYIEVERMRFGDRLCVLVDLAAETQQALVPTFLLQPLVENAIKHGLRGLQSTGRIQIRSIREDSRLMVSVSDNGAGLAAESLEDLEMGIGLGSTRERLARMYGGRHELAVRRLAEGGTEVRVSLPFRLQRCSVKESHEQSAVVNC